ncbi:MAG: phytanoyl-CoA dioxygenase family protein [Planctomycetes bacterium]|nr:phytanoyl-CoA dioxygenase family protein [Planctomycetota bacterium]
MLTGEQQKEFDRDGFVRIPGVLSSDQVRSVRAFLISLFDRAPGHAGDYNQPAGNVRFDACARYDELRWILLHPPVVEALRGLLGNDFVYLPETVAHDSIRGHWHKDTSAQQKAGHRFHWEPDYLMVQSAIYFQDNTPEYGGGLDIIPGSYLREDAFSSPLQRVTNRLRKKGLWPEVKGGAPVPTKAGDLVFFHFRSDHRGTPAAVSPIPSEGRKLALFFAASRNNRHVRAYCDYIAGRADYGYLKDHRYPESFLEEARRQGVGFAAPSPIPAKVSGSAADRKY